MQISLYYISGLNQDIEKLFSVLSLFEDRLSATDIKSLTIYIWKFHFKSMTSFSRQNSRQKIENNINIHHKNIFYCSKMEVNEMNTRRLILPQKSWLNMDK